MYDMIMLEKYTFREKSEIKGPLLLCDAQVVPSQLITP